MEQRIFREIKTKKNCGEKVRNVELSYYGCDEKKHTAMYDEEKEEYYCPVCENAN